MFFCGIDNFEVAEIGSTIPSGGPVKIKMLVTFIQLEIFSSHKRIDLGFRSCLIKLPNLNVLKKAMAGI